MLRIHIHTILTSFSTWKDKVLVYFYTRHHWVTACRTVVIKKGNLWTVVSLEKLSLTLWDIPRDNRVVLHLKWRRSSFIGPQSFTFEVSHREWWRKKNFFSFIYFGSSLDVERGTFLSVSYTNSTEVTSQALRRRSVPRFHRILRLWKYDLSMWRDFNFGSLVSSPLFIYRGKGHRGGRITLNINY